MVPADRFVVEEVDEKAEVKGWRLILDGWVEAEDRRGRCMLCPEPLVPGYPLACATHRARVEDPP